jgi:aryl-alcohol dehydrogenase-like predicted oxidoreductase
MTLFPWSSQGRGVFTQFQSISELRQSSLARAWYSKANGARIERARLLARERGVQPVTIALAWVLHQPFPVFPIIGPRTAAELASSARGVTVKLSDEEIVWLECGGRTPIS